MSHISPPVDFSITQNIPVADHIYKYLVKICGTDHIKANRSTYIGSLILSLQGRNGDVRLSKKRHSKIFKAEISECYYEKTGMFITQQNAQLFNEQVDKKFRDELFRNMLMNKQLDEKHFLKSMRRFLDFYEITEDDIKIEALHRDFKRKKDELLSNFNTLCPAGTVGETSQFVPKN